MLLISKIWDWLSSFQWGSASDVVGAIANTIMAVAALWGVKTANNWISSKANKAADDVFDELHALSGKYLKVYNMALSGYETVCRMYGLHDKLNPTKFLVYEEDKAVTEKSAISYELLSSFKDSIRRSLAVKTKYYDGAGHIDFFKLIIEHDEFFKQTVDFFRKTREIILQQHSTLDKHVFESYEELFKNYSKAYDAASKSSHDIKSLKISEIFEIH
ncbi:hypothetical protein [Pantoea cypripedii]|uniref:Uncharacterized protein n=1 Tax=Pantoea cypripedii TaxID=55209 RepID=A0A6B9FYT1_PANCY|nr:hypothetical protein [Pantoea cypripedii]QGY29372.1 hypothetical protein CUN67_10680 [Pantoea cypripedii]